MAVFSEIVELIPDVIGIFKPKEPTPEEQKQKAGVWYKMLQDFVLNEPTPDALANSWRDQLPFKQKSTRRRFVDNNIRNQSTDVIIDVLVGKINDELVKGGFAAISKTAILSGMGVSGLTVESPAGLSAVNAGVVDDSLGSSFEGTDANESRIYFYAIGLIALFAGVMTYLFYNPNKKRR